MSTSPPHPLSRHPNEALMTHAQVHQGQDGQWYYRIVAPNGETIATSEGYTRKADAIRAVENNVPDAELEVDD